MISLQHIFAARELAIDFDSIEEAVKSYQYGPDDSTFAYIFVGVYKIALNASKKYSIINKQEVMSTAMINCLKAIQDFDSSRNLKFSTLFTTYLTNDLKSQMKSLNYSCRVLNLTADSYDYITENGYDVEKDCDFTIGEVLADLPSDLTNEERKYCEIVLRNTSVDDTDIAKLLNVSNVSVSRMKKRLQQKLNFLVA